MSRELVIVSGKGGTGKTSVAASLALLAGRPPGDQREMNESVVIADCDVDAADLHLLLRPRITRQEEFRSGRLAEIREQDCTGCGVCLEMCRFGAITSPHLCVSPEINASTPPGQMVHRVDPRACEGCGVCVRFCPAGAIDFHERVCGAWMISETRGGPMVHARLHAGAENSGKLVTLVRREARRIAEEGGHEWLIVDGPPGIGCPVIASMTGASMVLAVAEPTVSGEHDLCRLLALAAHFSLPAAVCVNKWDLNPEMAARIEKRAREAGAHPVARIRYDPETTRAQLMERAVVETSATGAGEDLRQVWEDVRTWMEVPGRVGNSAR